jgi:predicted nucleic acid-binding protein
VNVLVDTSVWSLALRRGRGKLNPTEIDIVKDLSQLVLEGRARIVGVVRQELLSGIRDLAHFDRIRQALRSFPDEILREEDYEVAAMSSNRCRSRGIATSPTDMLICAVAESRDYEIFSTDTDFKNYSAAILVKLHSISKTGR